MGGHTQNTGIVRKAGKRGWSLEPRWQWTNLKKKLKHLATRPVDLGATSAFTSSNLEKTRHWNEGNFFSASYFFFQWSTHAATPTPACPSPFLHESYCSCIRNTLRIGDMFLQLWWWFGRRETWKLSDMHTKQMLWFIFLWTNRAHRTHARVTKKQGWDREKGREGE